MTTTQRERSHRSNRSISWKIRLHFSIDLTVSQRCSMFDLVWRANERNVATHTSDECSVLLFEFGLLDRQFVQLFVEGSVDCTNKSSASKPKNMNVPVVFKSSPFVDTTKSFQSPEFLSVFFFVILCICVHSIIRFRRQILRRKSTMRKAISHHHVIAQSKLRWPANVQKSTDISRRGFRIEPDEKTRKSQPHVEFADQQQLDQHTNWHSFVSLRCVWKTDTKPDFHWKRKQT